MAQDEVAQFRDKIFESGLLVDGGVKGLYQRSGTFERIVQGVAGRASEAGRDFGAPQLHFAPVIPRDILRRSDYLRSFPDLIGSISTFSGNDRDHVELLRLADAGEDWSKALAASEVVLGSAACHSLYQNLTGTLPDGGVRFEIEGFCFRHEPSVDPVRMQSFRQREFVYVGTPEGAIEHRDLWLDRGLDLLRGLGLEVEAVVANDPFFGRAGRMLKANQRESVLKYEIVAEVSSKENPTAIASSNCHEDHFGLPFDIRTADGLVAHSACIGYGLERVTLALLKQHGFDVDEWPSEVRKQLAL